jgi:hypothetical protein
MLRQARWFFFFAPGNDEGRAVSFALSGEKQKGQGQISWREPTPALVRTPLRR